MIGWLVLFAAIIVVGTLIGGAFLWQSTHYD